MSKWQVANIGVILTVTKKETLLTENPLPLSKQATTFWTIWQASVQSCRQRKHQNGTSTALKVF